MSAEPKGKRLIIASWVGTAASVVATALALASVDRFGVLAATVSMLLFVAGSVIFLVAFAIAVGRSRRELIGVGGLYFLAGCAPGKIRLTMLGSTALQVLIGVLGGIAQPFTFGAFGILVPIYGLGLAGLWGARHGTFPERLHSSHG